MKRILGLAVALLLAGGANARAKDAFEDVIKDTLSTMKDVTVDRMTVLGQTNGALGLGPSLIAANEQIKAATGIDLVGSRKQ